MSFFRSMSMRARITSIVLVVFVAVVAIVGGAQAIANKGKDPFASSSTSKHKKKRHRGPTTPVPVHTDPSRDPELAQALSKELNLDQAKVLEALPKARAAMVSVQSTAEKNPTASVPRLRTVFSGALAKELGIDATPVDKALRKIDKADKAKHRTPAPGQTTATPAPSTTIN